MVNFADLLPSIKETCHEICPATEDLALPVPAVDLGYSYLFQLDCGGCLVSFCDEC